MSVEQINATFWLVNSSGYEHQLVLNDTESVTNSLFNPDWPTKILVHGFSTSANSSLVCRNMTTPLDVVNNYKVNIICVNWAQGANVGFLDLGYQRAVGNTRLVGRLTGQFLLFLQNSLGQTKEQFHLIGHSLGAHICAYGSRYFTLYTETKIARISGLDPAGPLYDYAHRRNIVDVPLIHLHKEDAEYVDNIHTDGDPLIPDFGFGTQKNWGHVAFYPNGGMQQPGCWNNPDEKYPKIIPRFDVCNHDRAIKLYIQSMKNEYSNDCRLTGIMCDNWSDYNNGSCNGNKEIPLGYYSKPEGEHIWNHGKYYLNTTMYKPFCV